MKKDKSTIRTEQLIAKLRGGEQEAFSTLLQAYQPLLGSEVARHANGLCEADLEDLRQIALIALYRAAMSYDLAQSEVEFGLYAKICISNAIISQCRMMQRHASILPLPDTDEASASEDDPVLRVLEQESAARLHARIRSVLSPYENRVWTLYTSGLRSGEIARQLGKPTHSVENAVYRIRQKLRAALGNG